MIHVLHDEQFSLVKKFLGCFVKPECIKDLRPKKLAHLEITHEMLQKEVFLEQSTHKLLEKWQGVCGKSKICVQELCHLSTEKNAHQ